ncbi:MAG TPA: hypothetical protein P5044_05930, partial [bacterium]|nr:hypothetical protein [bacterium]
MKFLKCSLFVVSMFSMVSLQAVTVPDRMENPFIENAGQHEYGILFLAGIPGGAATVSDSNEISYRIGNTVFTERFEFLKEASFSGLERSNAVINIYKENFTASGIPAYRSLSAANDGVSVTLRSSSGTFEKIFTVNPGTDPCSIKISVNDAELIENLDGKLVIHTGRGTASFTAPVAWQETVNGKRSVEVAYVADGKNYGFAVGNYDREIPLFIDPLLTGVFIGGNAVDEAAALAVAQNKDIIIAGPTFSGDFPVTDSSTYKSTNNLPDCMIVRYNPFGEMKAATYFGGSRSECSTSGTDDSWTNLSKTYYTALTTIGDSVFLGSVTYSNDLPVSTDAYDKTCGSDGSCNGGQPDAFIAKFDKDLIFEAATYFGGAGADKGRTITNEGGNVVIAGSSNSTDLAPGVSFGGGDYDIFAASLSGDLKTMNAAKLIGGNDTDRAMGASSNANGIYLTGITGSSNFPVTDSAFDKTFGSGGEGDIFVVKLNKSSLAVEAATYLGGGWTEYGYAIAAHSNGSVYVAGATYGEPDDGFPVTAGAYKTTAVTNDNGSNWRTEGFIAKLSKDLNTLDAATYLGGTGQDDIKAIAFAPDGQIIVAGFTNSSNFPVTENAFDTTPGGGWDGFVSIISADLSTLSASTLIGGTGEDRLFGTGFDDFGNPAVCGFTTSSEIPGITGVKNGSTEMIFARIAPDLKASSDTPAASVDPDSIDFGT